MKIYIVLVQWFDGEKEWHTYTDKQEAKDGFEAYTVNNAVISISLIEGYQIEYSDRIY